jgi:hypothetical protein
MFYFMFSFLYLFYPLVLPFLFVLRYSCDDDDDRRERGPINDMSFGPHVCFYFILYIYITNFYYLVAMTTNGNDDGKQRRERGPVMFLFIFIFLYLTNNSYLFLGIFMASTTMNGNDGK